MTDTTIDRFNILDTSPPDLGHGPGAPMFDSGPRTRIRRTPVRAIASVTWEGGPREIFGQVLNVSPGGCLLKTESTIAPGTTLTMGVMIVQDGARERREVTAEVKHRTEHDGRRAYGVEFDASSPHTRDAVRWLYSRAAL